MRQRLGVVAAGHAQEVRRGRGGRGARRLAIVALVVAAGSAIAVDMTDRLRGGPILDTIAPPPIANTDNSDVRRQRAYAMQPPVVPHKIDGYQLDRNANRCMFCHARSRTQESQAPMISVTHFMDRDGNFLAELSPRRYFCLQCHVPQAQTNPPVGNRFVDVDTLLNAPAASAPRR